MEVSLRPDLEQFVRDEIARGHYADENEALNAAAELLHEREVIGADTLARMIAVGQAQADRGQLIDGDQAFAERRRQRAQRRTAS